MKIGNAQLSNLPNLNQATESAQPSSSHSESSAQDKVKGTLAQKGTEIFEGVLAATPNAIQNAGPEKGNAPAGKGKDVKNKPANVEGQGKTLESKGKDLENQDKLGNFEIQDLMSQYNQSETLSSSVQKKADDTAKAVIQKVS